MEKCKTCGGALIILSMNGKRFTVGCDKCKKKGVTPIHYGVIIWEK